jgi:predicted nucleic acid-binding protein
VSVLYLDASAITKLLIPEPESEALLSAVRGNTLISSRVVVVEVGKAVARADPSVDPQRVLARLAFVELDADLAQIAAGTGSAVLRSLDAIHVASALRVGGEIAAFVTYDDRQASAAQSAGLTVVSPS